MSRPLSIATLARASTGSAAKTPLRAAIQEDCARARALEAALGKGGGNGEEIARAVADLSQGIEQRQGAFPEAFAGSGGTAGAFSKVLNEDVAVPMRRRLREREQSPKTWAEAFEDRPRAPMERMRNTILRAPNKTVCIG